MKKKDEVKESKVKKEERAGNSKQENIDLAIAALNKKFGSGVVARVGETGTNLNIERVSTGIFALDLATGGGLPKGRIVEVYGDKSAGKSLISLLTAAGVLKDKGQVALIDLEHAFDPEWAKRLGVDINQIIFSQPDTAEQACDVVDSLIRSRGLDLCIIDSVAAFSTEREQEESSTDQQMGDTAKLTNKLIRKVTSALQPEDLTNKDTFNKCLVFFINQTRDKIGVLYGDPSTTPGGKGLPFHASIRIQMKFGDIITKDADIIGRTLKFKVAKNKVAPPYRVGEFDFYVDGHVDNFKSLVLFGISLGLIKQTGPYYTYQEVKYLGKDKLLEALRQDPKIESILKQEIEQIYHNK